METIMTELVIFTPTEKKKCPAKIEWSQKDDGDCEKIRVSVTLDGVCYFGDGEDYMWADAFADLQRNLPSNVSLACCMTCRHGNMCPFGNEPRQLFCTKDLTITDKDDMIALFEAEDAFGKREVLADAYCNDFEYQSDNCYTYNDYLFCLQS